MNNPNYIRYTLFLSKYNYLAWYIFFTCFNKSNISDNLYWVAASLLASFGFGWVSINSPSIPVATAAFANGSINSGCPPDSAPIDGCCNEWVAS